jgi:hypothetical protein
MVRGFPFSGLVAGAIISAIAGTVSGIISAEYSQRRRETRRAENWARRLEVLLGRFKHDLDGDSHTSAAAISDVAEQRDFKRRTSLHLEELGDHLTESPVPPGAKAWDAYEEMIAHVELLQGHSEKRTEYTRKMNDIHRQAETIEEWARESVDEF